MIVHSFDLPKLPTTPQGSRYHILPCPFPLCVWLYVLTVINYSSELPKIPLTNRYCLCFLISRNFSCSLCAVPSNCSHLQRSAYFQNLIMYFTSSSLASQHGKKKGTVFKGPLEAHRGEAAEFAGRSGGQRDLRGSREGHRCHTRCPHLCSGMCAHVMCVSVCACRL